MERMEGGRDGEKWWRRDGGKGAGRERRKEGKERRKRFEIDRDSVIYNTSRDYYVYSLLLTGTCVFT